MNPAAEGEQAIIRPVRAEVDLARIRHNTRYLKTLIPRECRFMAVVKANAYGHGALEVSRAALQAGADCLGVALLQEAVELRRGGIGCPIHLLFEIPPSAAEAALLNEVTCTVYTRELALALSRAAVELGRTARVNIKVDTGMRRVGVEPGQAGRFAELISGLEGLTLEGVCTHFATATEPENDFTDRQMDLFEAAAEEVESVYGRRLIRHAANSAAVLAFPRSHYDMVRVGIAMYGLAPSDALADPELRPALSLVGEVSFVKKVGRGEGISYGLEYAPGSDTLIGTLPLGYADGFTRLLSGRADVIINGRRRPVVGVICMDMCMVELGDGDVAAGAPAVIIGRQGGEEITVDEIALALGTINYEILCMISSRVPRIYIDSELKESR